VHATSFEARDADHYVGRQDRHQDEDRHQGHLHLEHLRQDHQVERHQGHQDEGQNQDVNQDHQDQYADHQD
jgi:hypothetical protein